MPGSTQCPDRPSARIGPVPGSTQCPDRPGAAPRRSRSESSAASMAVAQHVVTRRDTRGEERHRAAVLTDGGALPRPTAPADDCRRRCRNVARCRSNRLAKEKGRRRPRDRRRPEDLRPVSRGAGSRCASQSRTSNRDAASGRSGPPVRRLVPNGTAHAVGPSQGDRPTRAEPYGSGRRAATLFLTPHHHGLWGLVHNTPTTGVVTRWTSRRAAAPR